MNYELCKQLKDAGFPQEGLGMFWDGQIFTTNDIYSDLYQPTLSDLIESCGDEFLDLTNGISEWYADSVDENNNLKFHCLGSTPSEAVAHLWLALNKQ